MELRTPKGTNDYSPEESTLYTNVLDKIKSIFTLHGAVPLETPVFELKSILLNKYGEDYKLIYDVHDGSLALRYDLTVPFARYMSMNKLKKMKKYQIGKVYRRDQPSKNQGRLREFVQADFDIAGEGLPMMIDSELICIINHILSTVYKGEFIIRVNDRRILFGILELCNIDELLFGSVCSTIDKMDKMNLHEINSEFIDKGLNNEQITKLFEFIKLKGKENILFKLMETNLYIKYKDVIDELILLFRYCDNLNCSKNLIIDLSLARGLDYYTGLIIEGTYLNKEIGSVVGGGRYDNLISNLSGSDKIIPCAGFSIGVTRIVSLLTKDLNEVETVDVFISTSGNLFVEERQKLLKMFWANNIKSETFYTKRSNVNEHKKYCKKKRIRYLIVIGEQEWKNKCVNFINIENDTKIIENIENLCSIIMKNK